MAATRSGSLNPVAFTSKIPPKPPIMPLDPILLVDFMKGFISSTNRSPESISTPEPLYVRELFLVFSVIVLSAGMKCEIECVSLYL